MLVRLPNGLLDGSDLFNYAEIDELRGKQQNYLADKELVVDKYLGHIPKVLEDMVLALQTAEGLKWKGKIPEAIWKLSNGDLETLLIRVRENTYGPRFYFEAVCSHCEHLNKDLRVNLDTLKLEELSIEDRLTPKVFVLPKTQLRVELKPIYLQDLFDIIKITKNKQDKLITSLVCVSIKKLGDKDVVTEKDIEKLPMTDINALQEYLSNTTLEGSIDTEIETACKSCGKDFTTKLDCYSPLFFDPSKGSTTTPM